MLGIAELYDSWTHHVETQNGWSGGSWPYLSVPALRTLCISLELVYARREPGG